MGGLLHFCAVREHTRRRGRPLAGNAPFARKARYNFSMTTLPTVAVAMSGGVDSSVAAALLRAEGYRVLGIMLRLWTEPGREAENRCCTIEATDLARHIARQLDIPFHLVDAREAFRETVVQYFLEGYTGGVTPNPCLVCNREIRWGLLWQHARALGADLMATGHYARLERDAAGNVHLLQGVDAGKDQSYVLSRLTQAQLRRTLLPIGAYTKDKVRQMARAFHLPVANRPDSQDLCFLAGGDYRDFLRRHVPTVEHPGPIYDTSGRRLGTHQGLAFYTIGQRKGLGLAAPQPLYVVAKDPARNALIVGPREALGQRVLEAAQANWIVSPPRETFRAQVQIRATARPQPARVTPQPEGRFRVVFDHPQRDITPGQAAAVYVGEECLGSGIIVRALRDE